MKTKDGKKFYTKPVITTEKVFEQAALSCTIIGYANPVNASIKARPNTCGFASS